MAFESHKCFFFAIRFWTSIPPVEKFSNYALAIGNSRFSLCNEWLWSPRTYSQIFTRI